MVGILLEGLEQNTIISKCKIFNNTSKKGKSFGIKLGSENQINNLVTNCKINKNIIDLNFGLIEQFGIKDFSEGSTNIFLKNQATGHGKVIGDNINERKSNYFWTLIDQNQKISNAIIELDRDFLKILRTKYSYENISIN